MKKFEIEQRIEKTKKDIGLFKANLRKLDTEREQRLLNEDSISQVNGEIADTQRKISEKTLLMQALERKRVETEELEKETQRQARIKELEAEATKIRREVVELVDNLKEYWGNVEATITAVDKAIERARLIRNESRGLGASNILANLPSPNIAIFFNEVPRANLQTFFKRIKGQLKKD